MPPKKFNFTKKFLELEKITRLLESGSLDLDKSLVQFEKGLKIAADLKKRLEEVKNKIKVLKKRS